METKGKILIVDDNDDVLFALNLLLEPYVEKVKVTTQPSRIEHFMTTFEPDVILLDMNFSRDAISGEEGFDCLEQILKIDSEAVVLFMTAYADTAYVLRLETAAVCGMAVLRKLLPLLIAAFLFCGCGKPASMNHPLMKKGTEYRDEGKYDLALQFYKNCLKKHPDSPDVMLAIAQLCDEGLNDPVTALYYYEEYLKIAPAQSDLELVKNSRDLVRRRLGRMLERETGSLERLEKENLQLKKQNDLLRRVIINLRKQMRALRTPVKTDKKAVKKPAKKNAVKPASGRKA